MIYAVKFCGAVCYDIVSQQRFFSLQKAPMIYTVMTFLFVNEFLIIKIKIKHGKRKTYKQT